MNESCELEIEFCSSHFYEIARTLIFSIPIDVISNILSNESLRLKNEETLFEIISSQQHEDSRFFSLFEYVRFEYLSTNAIESFIEMINESFDFLTFPIWRSLCYRLLSPVSIDISNDEYCDKSSSAVFRFDPNSPQNGIISYLKKRFGGDVIDRNIISITANSFYNPQSYPIRCVAEFENKNCF
jgi:hypothetical protein